MELLFSKVFKIFLSVFVVSLIFFFGNGEAKAASTSWPYYVLVMGNPIPAANFYASSNKDVYSPGEPITITGAASLAPLSSAGLSVWVNVNYPSAAICSAPTSCGGSASFNAPATPGPYYISLVGCWYYPSWCAYSSMAVTVASPPSVFLQFSFLDKAKSILSDPVHLFDTLKQTT